MATMSDIAAECGVSRAVVSLVLNGRDREVGIAVSTRDRILDAAERLKYCRNEMAAAISGKYSNVLAFVTAEMGKVDYTGRIQNGVLDAALERGYTVTVYRLNKFSFDDIVKKILGWRTAGVIFHVAELETVASIIETLDMHGIPWGTVNLANEKSIGVTSDDRSGIFDAVRLLGAEKHRKIAYFAVHDTSKAIYQRERETGYIEGIKHYFPSQMPYIVHVENYALLNDFAVVKKYADDFIRNNIDGIICESDILAFSLLSCVQKMGYSVPEIFSLVGFGNLLVSESCFPRLTTIEQNFEIMGSNTVNLLADVINKKENGYKEEILPVKIIMRESVKKRSYE